MEHIVILPYTFSIALGIHFVIFQGAPKKHTTISAAVSGIIT